MLSIILYVADLLLIGLLDTERCFEESKMRISLYTLSQTPYGRVSSKSIANPPSRPLNM